MNDAGDPASDRRRAIWALLLVSLGFAALYLWPDTGSGLEARWSWLSRLEKFHLDKLVHLTMTFVLALVYATSLLRLNWMNRPSRLPIWIAAGSAVAYSGVLELLQTWVPGRVCTLADFLANTAGVLLFVGLARSGVFRLPRR